MNRRRWLILGVVGLVLAGGGYAAWQARAQSQTPAAAITTGAVTQITAVVSFDAAGTVEPSQSAALFWQTTGQVKAVNVKIGDMVKAGDVLMALDPANAPSSLLMARADLAAAQAAMEALKHPSPISLATAKKAVAEAQTALIVAQRTLGWVQHPGGPALQMASADARLALDNAVAEQKLASISPDAQAYDSAKQATVQATRALQSARDLNKLYPGSGELQDAMTQAQAAYDAAVTQEQYWALRLATDKVNRTDVIAKAQAHYDQTLAKLAAVKLGPNPEQLRIAQSTLDMAQASLADAQAKLDKLVNGPSPQEVDAAAARTQVVQATIATMTITAPFGGQVTAVNFQPGDLATQSPAAVELANRSVMHVLILVNEADINRLTINDPVTVTIKSLSGRELAGQIAAINPRGANVKGLIKYTVRVNLTESDPGLLLGMTANVTVVTDVQPDVLAVPLDAVQTDEQGEYVNRLTPAGAVERVGVVSSVLQGVNVVVTGDLQPGDNVVLGTPPAAAASNPLNLLVPNGGGP